MGGYSSSNRRLVRVARHGRIEKDQDTVKKLKKKLAELETEFTKLEFSLMFSGDHDQANAIVNIHTGAGGTDAQDWAEMIMQILFRLLNVKVGRCNYWMSRGGEAGIKSAVFALKVVLLMVI